MCHKLFFADDLKLFTDINCAENCIALQSDLDRLESWCDVNKLYLNTSKCKIISFNRKQSIYRYDYTISNSVLVRCDTCKDLGILFDFKLTFSQHIAVKTDAANKMYGFIVRNCKSFTNIEALKILYFSYVRSKLEYGSIIWHPYYRNHKIIVERIQRKFLKFLSYKVDGIYPVRGVPYIPLINRFELVSLDLRRKCAFLTFLYKLLHNQIDSPELLGQLNFSVPRLSNRHNLTFYCNTPRTNMLLKSPVYVMCSNFNKLCHVCDIHFCSLRELIHIAVQYLDEELFT